MTEENVTSFQFSFAELPTAGLEAGNKNFLTNDINWEVSVYAAMNIITA